MVGLIRTRSCRVKKSRRAGKAPEPNHSGDLHSPEIWIDEKWASYSVVGRIFATDCAFHIATSLPGLACFRLGNDVSAREYHVKAVERSVRLDLPYETAENVNFLRKLAGGIRSPQPRGSEDSSVQSC